MKKITKLCVMDEVTAHFLVLKLIKEYPTIAFKHDKESGQFTFDMGMSGGSKANQYIMLREIIGFVKGVQSCRTAA